RVRGHVAGSSPGPEADGDGHLGLQRLAHRRVVRGLSRTVYADGTGIPGGTAKGFTAMSLPETPYGVGLPSFYTDHWDPVFTALCDTDMAICMHIGGAFNLLQRPEGAAY